VFDLSLGELGVILATATLVVGPKDMPTAVRAAGRAWAKFKRFTNGMKAQFDASPIGQELRAAQAEVDRETRLIYDAHGTAYESFSLDGLQDASRATPLPLPTPLPEPRTLPADEVAQASATKP
jgi:sec-independent protein translocase protein TatB